MVVIAQCPSTCEALTFARELNAGVFNETPEQNAQSRVRNRLQSLARSAGYPGVVLVQETEPAPNIAGSLERVSVADSYLVEAVAERRPEAGKALVGVPAYNEEESIEGVVTEALQFVDSVLVVDDGSGDETARRAREAGATVISHRYNKGYGATLKTIFENVDAWGFDRLVVLDGDGQHEINDIPALVEPLRADEADVVIGSRFKHDGTDVPFFRRGGLKVINTLTNIVLKPLGTQTWLSDTQSGLRAYNRHAIETLAADTNISDGMAGSIDTLFTCAQIELRITEVASMIRYDVEDSHTHSPVSHGATLLRNIIRIVETEFPITLLGLPGLLFLLVGLGFGYWTILNYFQTAVFPLGLAVTATFFTLTGVFSMFTAIILHALNEYANRYDR